VVAVNKIDKDGANPDRVLQQLADRGLVSEQYGGDTQVVRTSAKSGDGIDDLLENILVTADILVQPKANPKRAAVGTVIDSHLERGRGPIATVLVQNGTLKVGDNFVAGAVYGKVRALLDDTGHKVQSAGPSTPVVVTGMSDVVVAGEVLHVTDTERAARTLAEQRALAEKQRQVQPVRHISLASLEAHAAEGETKTLNLVLKAEANGSLEALRGQIAKLGDDPAVKIKVVGEGVGAVSESDVNLAKVSDAIVIGFNVRPDDRARAAADDLGVDVRYYDVVYHVTEDIEKAVKGMYEPRMVEVFQGRAEVRRVFTVDGKNAIAGSHVLDGKITRNAVCKVLRDGAEVAHSRIEALKRFKDDVREVVKDYDCGITLADFNEFQEGDVIEAYVVEQQNL
jgi:translation initiation factor IF-2